ncbi:MAG: HEAT repeat domain-containing protein, partial [Deltaproteobacteria bacterium]|nr:HEAT repeat domain-containing protein [Deltaproteobacteria bacterium]
MRSTAAALALLAALGLPAPVVASEWPGRHERIVRSLTSTDSGARRLASTRLLELPPATARERTRLALRDPDVEVRLHAARAATVLGLERAGDEVLGWLQESDPRLRIAACQVVGATPTSESTAALPRVLADGKAEVREAAARAMGASGSVELVSALLGRLDDTATPVRRAVIRALGRLGDPRASVPLMSKLQDPEPEVRAEAARVLGGLGDVRAAMSLELALGDRDGAVRMATLAALARLRASTSARAIAALLTNDGISTQSAPGALDHATRQAAIKALAQLGSPDAVRALASMLEAEGPVAYSDDASAHVRRALVSVGGAAQPVLQDQVESSRSSRASSAAAMALAQLSAPATKPAVVKLIAQAARRGSVALPSALAAMGRIGDASVLPFVLEHVAGPDAEVREIAVEVATLVLDPTHPDGRVIDIVRDRVLDPRTGLGERAALARLVGRTGSPRAVPILLELLPRRREPSASLGASPLLVAALDGLGDLGDATPEVEARLLAYLGHPAERVRGAAAMAGARVGRDAMAAKLIERLRDSAEQDRFVLALALSGTLARSKDARLVGPLGDTLDVLSGRLRDSLIEGLGRSSLVGASGLLERLARSADVDDRRKVAEALHARTELVEVAAALARDADPGVRANAVWSLGSTVDAARVAVLREAIRDIDAAVAGNAAFALALAARRLALVTSEAQVLCGLLEHPRSYVVAQALVGLRLVDGTCAPGAVRRLVASGR